jgi:hypothetical protein
VAVLYNKNNKRNVMTTGTIAHSASEMRGGSFSASDCSPYTTLIAALSYALLVVAMWGTFAFSSGMPYETAFAYNSDTQPWWKGFFYVDPLRIHTSTFYHLSYLLGKVVGATGSFVPYQFVYAALWWAKGLLLFLIVRRLFPSAVMLAYTVGAIALVHASDLSLQWVGQLNQLGFSFWLLLSLYCFIRAFECAQLFGAGAWLALASTFQYMCLWSYESPLFIILAGPIVIAFLLFRPVSRRLLTLSGIWYAVPAVYIALSLREYLHSRTNNYQESILRHSWGVQALASDLWFNIYESACFWQWRAHPTELTAGYIHFLASAAVVAFVGAGYLLIRSGEKNCTTSPKIRSGVVLRLLAAGFVVLALSFPAYLLLNSARSLWRTQLLSGIGAGMFLGAACLALLIPIAKWRWQQITALALATPMVFVGASRAIERGATHRDIWRRHQFVMQQVIRVAPEVRPGTIFVLLDVPRNTESPTARRDPFGDDLWFDMALRLAYPRVPVNGVYYYGDHTPAPGDNLQLASNLWTWSGKGFVHLIRQASLAQTIVLKYNEDGQATLLMNLPSFLCSNSCSPGLYDPLSRIAGHSPSPEAVRRYGPL